MKETSAESRMKLESYNNYLKGLSIIKTVADYNNCSELLNV